VTLRKTIGIVFVACCIAVVLIVPPQRMTAGDRLTISLANSLA
jgi:hypothetical protein